MSKPIVAIVPYTNPYESVKAAVDLSNGFQHLSPGSSVFIKPNIVFWSSAVPFPKWGVITTSRIVEDIVILLKEHGIDKITIGEGSVAGHRDTLTYAHAVEHLGYHKLKQRYGVKVINVMERPFEKVDLGDDSVLRFNTDILNCDFIVNLPVLKTHIQTVVSLGIKNLKGTIDMPSRKKCHSSDPIKDLHYYVARLADPMPTIFTLVDGIFSNERGPGFDGRIRRSNLLIASADLLSADLVGARVLGYEATDVPHLAQAAFRKGRPTDLSDITLVGEVLEKVSSRHEYDFDYGQDANGCWLPTPLLKQGMKGLSFRKYDSTICTYCSHINGMVLNAIRAVWQKEQPWDNVEILSGKAMKATKGMKKTILLGKCIYQANKDNPDIQEMIAVKGCPPDPEHILKALHRAGIMVDEKWIQQMDRLPGRLMPYYVSKPEFEDAFFQIM
jgi:uncharacterized protein (DUF362 family)